MPSVLSLLISLSPSAAAQVAITGQPGVYPDIGSALAVALPGDELLVDPGTLDETVVLSFDVSIRGAGWPTAPTTWGNASGAPGPLVAVDPGVTVALEGFVFDNPSGRALELGTGSTVEVRDFEMAGFTGVEGAAIHSDAGDLTLISGWVHGNDAVRGGALFARGGSLLVDDTTFEDNIATEAGGSIALRDGTSATFAYSAVARSTAEDGGGLHAIGSGATLASIETWWQANDAVDGPGPGSGHGGSLWTLGYAVELVGGMVNLNSGDQHPVGRFEGSPAELIAIRDTTVALNTSRGGQGAVRTVGTNVEMRGTLWLDNIQGQDVGWTMPGWYATGDFDLATFEDNEFQGEGRVLVISPVFPWNSEVITLRRNTFTGVAPGPYGAPGVATFQGAAVIVEENVLHDNEGGLSITANGTTEVVRNDFCGNQHQSGGGALHILGDGLHRLDNNAFVRNASGLGGGAVWVGAGNLFSTNNAFLENDAPQGGAVYASVSPTWLAFSNDIVAYTSGAPALEAVQPYPLSSFDHSLFWANGAGDLGGGLTSYNLVNGSNLFVQPEFVDWTPGAPCGTYSLVPLLGGPQIDAGRNLDPDGSAADLGPYGGPRADPAWFADDDADTWIALYDCDDLDGTAFPGADEVCDGDDESCDGVVDEPTAIDATDWFGDGDGDGYGAGAVVDHACVGPAGTVADSSDCDDGAAGVFPGAVEIANDGIDQDCDGVDLSSGTGTGTGTGTGAATGTGTGGSTGTGSGTGAATGTGSGTGASTGTGTGTGTGTATGGTRDSGDTGGRASDKGCGCGGATPSAGWLALAVVALRRRR